MTFSLSMISVGSPPLSVLLPLCVSTSFCASPSVWDFSSVYVHLSGSFYLCLPPSSCFPFSFSAANFRIKISLHGAYTRTHREHSTCSRAGDVFHPFLILFPVKRAGKREGLKESGSSLRARLFYSRCFVRFRQGTVHPRPFENSGHDVAWPGCVLPHGEIFLME